MSPIITKSDADHIEHELSIASEAIARISYNVQRLKCGDGYSTEHMRRAINYTDDALRRLNKISETLSTANEFSTQEKGQTPVATT